MSIKKNVFKQSLSATKPMFGLWMGIPDTTVAEIGAGAGFDWVLIDAEHGPFDLTSVLHHLQAIESHPVSTIVRPVEGQTALIKQYLDIGVQTLLIPMVDTAEQAEHLVQASYYPPMGIRGLGTSMARAANWNRTPDYLQRANEEICLIVQIESVEGLKNIDEIVALEGVDAVFIGPSDLSASMGYIGNPGHPEVVSAIEGAFKTIIAAGKHAGVLAVTKELVETYVAANASFIGVGVDAALLANATKQLAADFISDVDSEKSAGY